jgi:uncharacterized protein YdeI (YjbR/CyaY-like superfamily)
MALVSNQDSIRSFPTSQDMYDWLALNHSHATEVWVRIYKKTSKTPSVDWEECVVQSLIWGWIDSAKRPLDDVSFLQRLTPRRKGSNWSQKNCVHAERLISEGKMSPAGLVEVEAAKADGRWEKSYLGSSQMVIPEDFLDALARNATAQAFFETLNRTNLYSIYYRLQSAKKSETRAKRIAQFVAQLARCEKFH